MEKTQSHIQIDKSVLAGVHLFEKYQCPCCECFTYNVPPKEDCGYICPVCFWENDPFITSDSDPSDLNHGITLNEAKNNYLEFGACERKMLRYVRPPESDENRHSSSELQSQR